MAVEFLEDSRVEYLAMTEYPGMRRIFLALHPQPSEDACDPGQDRACVIGWRCCRARFWMKITRIKCASY